MSTLRTMRRFHGLLTSQWMITIEQLATVNREDTQSEPKAGTEEFSKHIEDALGFNGVHEFNKGSVPVSCMLQVQVVRVKPRFKDVCFTARDFVAGERFEIVTDAREEQHDAKIHHDTSRGVRFVIPGFNLDRRSNWFRFSAYDSAFPFITWMFGLGRSVSVVTTGSKPSSKTLRGNLRLVMPFPTLTSWIRSDWQSSFS